MAAGRACADNQQAMAPVLDRSPTRPPHHSVFTHGGGSTQSPVSPGATRSAPLQGAEVIVLGVGFVVVTALALAAHVRVGRLWGGDAYAFLPAAAWWCGLGATVALAWLAIGRAVATPAMGTPAPAARRTLGVGLGLALPGDRKSVV